MRSPIGEPADELRRAYGGRRVCVTGGAGFIGSHLVDALVALGAEVRVIDDFSSGLRENLADVEGRILLVQGSILDEGLQEAARGSEVIFHQAALTSVPGSIEEPGRYCRINAAGTQRVLEAARRTGTERPARVVYAASSSAYGMRDDSVLNETMVPLPASPYAAAKCAGELLLTAYAASYGLSGISLRYFNIFGPRQRPDSPYAAVIPRFASALLEGTRPVIYGDGLQTRDFTHVANAVHANLLAGASPRALHGEVVNVACGRSLDLLSLLRHIARRLGAEPVHDTGPARVGDVRHSRADIKRAEELIGYRPIVSFEEGLEGTLADLRKRRSDGATKGRRAD